MNEPNIERLRKRSDFLRIARRGRKWAAPGLVLQASPTPAAPDRDPATATPIRVGFTASRRVGGAVARNRARRRLREAARQVLPKAGRAGTDYVIIGRAETLTRPFPALVEDLAVALGKVAQDRGNMRRATRRKASTDAPA